MAKSFVALTGGGAGNAYQVGDKWGYQTAEKVRQNFDVLRERRSIFPLGGSRNVAVQHSAVVDVYDYLDIEVDGTDVGGLTVRARVEVRTENAATSVTPQIYNVTTTTVMTVSGAVACTATAADYTGTNQRQTLVFTPTTGVNKYRLRVTPSNATWRVWTIGYLEIL